MNCAYTHRIRPGSTLTLTRVMTSYWRWIKYFSLFVQKYSGVHPCLCLTMFNVVCSISASNCLNDKPYCIIYIQYILHAARKKGMREMCVWRLSVHVDIATESMEFISAMTSIVAGVASTTVAGIVPSSCLQWWGKHGWVKWRRLEGTEDAYRPQTCTQLTLVNTQRSCLNANNIA